MSKYNLRIWIIAVGFILGFGMIVYRLYDLQIKNHDFYRRKSVDQQKRVIKLQPRRGAIYDRNGNMLATSLSAYSLYANPTHIEDRKAAEQALKRLDLSAQSIQKILDYDGQFIWVKRQVMPEVALSIDVKGIYRLPDTIRVYPEGMTASNLLGFVGVDNEGLGGAEYSFDGTLRGKEGYIILESDLQGRNIFSYKQKVDPVHNGKDIHLTIDAPLQFMAENTLKRYVSDLRASHGAVVLSNIHTGEILCMANSPRYDPNIFFKYTNPRVFKNQAIGFNYEPGSVMKLFTFATALEEGIIHPGDKIYSPKRFVVSGYPIEEVEHIGDDSSPTKDVEDVIIKSLNVGAAKIGLLVGRDKLYKYLSMLEFGQRTNIQLPGEEPGYLMEADKWYPVDTSRIAFGYGVSTTPLQLLKAISVFGNEGLLIQPTLFKRSGVPNRKRIYSPSTAKTMLSIMQRTVEEGTGIATRLQGFTVGGKTGTARIFSSDKNAYLWGQYNNTFAGIFPISDPKYAMVVVISDPRRYRYASQTAVPVFHDILKQVLRYYHEPPR